MEGRQKEVSVRGERDKTRFGGAAGRTERE